MLAADTINPARKVWYLIINDENEPRPNRKLAQIPIEGMVYVDDLQDEIKKKEAIGGAHSTLKIWRYTGGTFSRNKDQTLKLQVRNVFLEKKVEELEPTDQIQALELFKSCQSETFFMQVLHNPDDDHANKRTQDGDAVQHGLGLNAPPLGAATSQLNQMVKNPSMTASGSNGSGFTITASIELESIYTKAWNKEWPSKNGSISMKACELGGDDQMQVDEESNCSTDEDAETHWDYECILDILELSRALEMVTKARNNVVIRADYEFILGVLESRVRASGDGDDKQFVLAGQPGIGKTIFLLYLLLHRLKLCLPTAIQVHEEKYVLFDKDGVAEYPPEKFNRHRLNSECWALCDSNQLVITPCLAFQASGAVIIQATSPKLERWKEWSKQKDGELIIMDLPRSLEIAAIAQEANFIPSRALDLMQKWGPSTRTIMYLLQNPHQRVTVERDAVNAAREVTKDPSIATSTVNQKLNSNASIILFVRPHRENCSGDKYNINLSSCVIEIPTPSLSRIFDEALSAFTSQQRLQLFTALSSHSLTRAGAGWAHELNMHGRMCQGGEALKLTPNGKIQPSKNLLSGTVDNLGYIEKDENFYWLPSVANFQGVDSVLGNEDGIYALQATIANEHTSPIEGLRKIWRAIKPAARGRSWHFVIVTDNAKSAKVLHETFAKDFEKRDFALGRGKARVRVKVWCCTIRGVQDRKLRNSGQMQESDA